MNSKCQCNIYLWCLITMRKINEISLLSVFCGAAKISSFLSVQMYKAFLSGVSQITSLIQKLPSWHFSFLPSSIHYPISSSKVLSTPLTYFYFHYFFVDYPHCISPAFCFALESYISHFCCFISFILFTINKLTNKNKTMLFLDSVWMSWIIQWLFLHILCR